MHVPLRTVTGSINTTLCRPLRRLMSDHYSAFTAACVTISERSFFFCGESGRSCRLLPSLERSSLTHPCVTLFWASASKVQQVWRVKFRRVKSGLEAPPGTIWSGILCPNTSRQTAAWLCCQTWIFTKKIPKTSVLYEVFFFFFFKRQPKYFYYLNMSTQVPC